MLPDDQPTIPTKPPHPSRSSPPGVWVAPTVEELQEKLPQYEVLEILGRGGMGAVYKARQKSLKRLVAIKILPLGLADDEMKFAERFQNEAQTMAAMNHPAIVGVHDFGETADGLLYFVMEFVDGTDVQRMIQGSGRLSGEHALAITAHVCDALHYAHSRGVIHRDIKPANILINQEGHIKVADFGLAKMHDPAQTSGLTRTNMAMGTPDYVAPEVLVTGMVADHRADIYAVGVMLYQMLTGEVPRGLFKLPTQKGIGSDERFDAIICKAMEQDRDERYQSAMDVRRDLDVILTTPQPKSDGTGVVPANELPQKPVAKQPRPPGQQNAAAQNQPPAKGAAKPAPAQKASAAAKAKPPPKKQSPASMWMSIGGIVAVLGVAGFFVLGGKSKPDIVADSSTSATSPSTKPLPPGKERENPKSTAPASSAAAKGKEIDLLPLVEVQRDMIGGEWSRAGGDLLVKGSKPDAKGTPRLQLPYQPPEEYDFEIEFTPESGTNMAGQALSAYQHSFSWFMDGKTNAGNKAGFDAIDGIGVASRTDGTTMRAKFLTNGQRHRSTVEVRRNRVRALLDGEPLVTWGSSPKSYERLEISKNEKMRDALHLGLIAYDRAVRFHKITVREVTGTGKVDADSGWTDWLGPRVASGKLPVGSWRIVQGGVTTDQPMSGTNVIARNVRDAAVRISYDLRDGSGIQITVRERSPGANRETYFADDTGDGLYLARMAPGGAITSIATRKFPAGTPLGGPRTLEFRCIGDRLEATVTGATTVPVTVSATDTTLTSGPCAVVLKKGALLKEVEVQELDGGEGMVEVSATKANDSPNIKNWQDITATLREKASKKAGLVVESDAVRNTGNAVASIKVSDETVRDRALRVRFTRGAQISLWPTNGTGSVSVLVGKDRTIFQRQTSPTGPATTLRPEVSHPSGFDIYQSHEVIITVQGSTARMWIDGRFIGEAQDEVVKGTSFALALFPHSSVQKVEFAELKSATADGWQPIFNQPSDFGGDMRDDVEFRDGATFIKSRTFLAPADPAIVGIRSTMRYLDGDRTGSLMLRSTEAAQFGEEDFALTAFIAPKGGAVVVKMRDRPAGINQLGRHDYPLSPALKEGEPFTFELRAENKKIIVSINGHEIGSLDDAWTGATRRFGITPSITEMTEFRDVAVRRVEGEAR